VTGGVVIREIAQGELRQGADERIVYQLTTTNWGSSPSAPVVKLYDVTHGSRTDVSTTNLSGSASVSGDVITAPLVYGLTAGNMYRLEWQFICSGNTFEAYASIVAEY